MAPGYVVAILFCLGDNCDLVRAEPEASYPNYKACSEAASRNGAKLGEIAARERERGREGEIICLRERLPVTGPDEERRTLPEQSPPAPGIPAGQPPGQEFRDCDQCPAMETVPSGEFQMGSGDDASERPVHRVKIAAFGIGKTAVTETEWNACVAEGACPRTSQENAEDANGKHPLPVMNVSWDDAQKYLQWLRHMTGKNYRLPTESEWEYAARAGTVTAYPWGRQVGIGKADCNGCGGEYDPHLPVPVASFPPNAWGLYDMAGGVAQWVEDCWHRDYTGAPADGSAWISPHCGERVLRGGSWRNPPKDLTVSSRNFYDASVRYPANSLRVALTLP